MSSIKRKSESEEEPSNKKAKAPSRCAECHEMEEDVFEVDGELLCLECANTCNDCGEFQEYVEGGKSLVFSEKYCDRICADCIKEREEREKVLAAADEEEEEEECTTCRETSADCVYYNNEPELTCPTCLKTCTSCCEMGEVDLDMDENAGEECIRLCAKCDRKCDQCEEIIAASEPLLQEASIATLGSIRLCGKCKDRCDVCAIKASSIVTDPLIGLRLCPSCAMHCVTCNKVINSQLESRDAVKKCTRCMHAALDSQLKSVIAAAAAAKQ